MPRSRRDQPTIDRDQLEAFWAVAQASSFHRAAEALFITQSAVTQRIKGLERVLGQLLFVRAGRTLAPTPAGEALIRYCRDLREREAGILAEIRGESAGFSGRVAIAAGTAEGIAWLAPAMAELGAKYPDLDLSLLLDDTLDPHYLLGQGLVDAALTDLPVVKRGLSTLQIGSSSLALVVSAGHCRNWPACPTWKQLSTLAAIDFAPRDRLTLDLLARCYPQQDLSALRRHFANNTAAIRTWVLKGGGFSAVPLEVLGDDLALGALRHLFPDIVTARPIYWCAGSGPPSPALAWLQARVGELLP